MLQPIVVQEGVNTMQGAVWCFKGDKWTLGTEYLRLWGARYAPFMTAEPSRHVFFGTPPPLLLPIFENFRLPCCQILTALAPILMIDCCVRFCHQNFPSKSRVEGRMG